MEGGEQTTISPEFLENIQSAVNSQGVLGQVQVIETENGPVTVLFMEEGADASNLGGENITLSVDDAGQNIGGTVDDPNAGVQYQYVETEEDYSQLLQGAVGDTVVSVADTVKEDLAAVQPVIDLPAADQATTETYEQPVGDTTTDTYYITDTGEILKIDSSLLGENAGDATLQLQTADGSLQILNQVGNVQASQVETQMTYPQSTVDNINITYDQGTPFEYTATKVDNPLVIDTARVEEPKVLSYKTTNRQRTNIMRQPVSKSPASMQSKQTITSQSIKSQTSLLSSQYKTIKQRDSSGITTEVVYPPSYQKQTIVFPKVQKQTPYANVIKTGQQSYQTKLKTAPQQMITTVMNPQSLLKSNVNQGLSSGAVVNKLSAPQIPAVKVTTPSVYTQKQVPAVNKLPAQVVSTQVPAATKQTDLLSVAMKQAEVPEQVLSSVPALHKIDAKPVALKDHTMTTHNIESPGSEPVSDNVSKKVSSVLISSESVKDIGQTFIPSTTEVQVMEEQTTLELPETVSPTTIQEKEDTPENFVDSQIDDAGESKMETDEQPAEADQPVLDEKDEDDQKTSKTEKVVPDTSDKQVAINKFSEKGVNDEQNGENGDVKIVKVVQWDENIGLVEEKVSSSSERIMLGSENDANKFGTNDNNNKETKIVKKSNQSLDKRKEGSEKSIFKKRSTKENCVKKKVTEKIAFTRKVHNIPIKRVLKCEKCQFTTGKKLKLQQHLFEQHNIGCQIDRSNPQQRLFGKQEERLSDKSESQPHSFKKQDSCTPDKSESQQHSFKKQEISCSSKKAELQLKLSKTCTVKCKICREEVPSTIYSRHVIEMHRPKKFECEKCKEVFWSDESLRKHIKASVCESVDINRKEARAAKKLQVSSVSKDKVLKNSEQTSVEKIDDDDEDDDDCVEITEVTAESDDNLIEISDCETAESDNEHEKHTNVKIAGKENYDTTEITEWPRLVLERVDCDEVVSSRLPKSYEKHSMSKNTCSVQLNEGDIKSSIKSHSRNRSLRSSDERSCIFCKKIFFGNNKLNKHLRSVHTGPFKCYRCKTLFRKKMEYKEHLKSHKERNYKCIRCAQSFPNWRQKNFHMRTKHMEKQYLCELCGRKMVMKNQYLVHMKLHQGIYPFSCSQCNFGFLKKYILEKHKKKCGTEAETKYLIKIQNYRDKALLFERKKVIGHHNCRLCNKLFLSMRCQTTHKRMVHGVVPKKKAPNIGIGYRELTVARLSESVKMSLSFKKNSFCSVNIPVDEREDIVSKADENSSLVDQDNDEESVNINELKKVYQCNFCKQCFHDLISVVVHVDVHKSVCSVCNQRLPNYTALWRHQIFGHSNGDGQGMKCTKCNEKFSSKNDLLDHMKVHIGPWVCEKKGCGVRFSDKKDLRKHRRTHSTGNIECVCKRRYKTTAQLKKHTKKKRNKCLPLEWPDGGIICMNENVQTVQTVTDISSNSVDSFIKKGKDMVVKGKGTIRGPYVCKKCKAQFVSHSRTKRHILLRHCKNTKERTYHCSLCDFRTLNSGVMKTHQKNHMSNFKCDFCPSSFEDEGNLGRHVQYHLKDKYQCLYCSKMFANRLVCRNHILTYHDKGKKKIVPHAVEENLKESGVRNKQLGYYGVNSSFAVDKGTIIVVNAPIENEQEHLENTSDGVDFDKRNLTKIVQKYINSFENSDINEAYASHCRESDGGTDNDDNDKESIEGINENENHSTADIDQTVETKLDKAVEKSHKLVSGKELKSGTTSVSQNTESKKKKENEVEKDSLRSVSPQHTSRSLTDGENVDQDNQILLNDPTLQPLDRTESDLLDETNPPRTSYNNLVDQIGTILTEDVWNTAQFEEEPSYSLMSEEVEPVYKFDKYKGVIPEGLELYIPLVEPYKCGGCDILCNGEINFRKHTQTLHTEGLRCKICNKRSTTQKILAAHMIDKHLVGMPLTCPECKTVFKKTNTYWRHAEMHVKCFPCTVCEQEFKRKMDLAEHVKSHVESKEFCVKCGQVFDSHVLLRVHSWKEHRTKMNKRRPPIPFSARKKRKDKGKKLQMTVDLSKKVCKSKKI